MNTVTVALACPRMMFTASDGLSGIATATPSSPLVLSAEGAAVAGTVTATDKAGNSAVAASPAVKIDKTPPNVTITRPADGSVYVLGANVQADYSCSDSLSGVASCIGAVDSGSAIDTAAAGPKTFTVGATDNAGNAATRTVTYSVVAAQPASTISSLMAQVVGPSVSLSNGNRQSLLSKLRAAQVSLNRGNRDAAVNQLGAFINEVQALKNSGRLDALTADSLTTQATSIINEIT